MDGLTASAEVAAIITASDGLRRELKELANVHWQRRVGGHVAHVRVGAIQIVGGSAKGSDGENDKVILIFHDVSMPHNRIKRKRFLSFFFFFIVIFFTFYLTRFKVRTAVSRSLSTSYGARAGGPS